MVRDRRKESILGNTISHHKFEEPKPQLYTKEFNSMENDRRGRGGGERRGRGRVIVPVTTPNLAAKSCKTRPIAVDQKRTHSSW